MCSLAYTLIWLQHIQNIDFQYIIKLGSEFGIEQIPVVMNTGKENKPYTVQ
jgi:hypothetical protein